MPSVANEIVLIQTTVDSGVSWTTATMTLNATAFAGRLIAVFRAFFYRTTWTRPTLQTLTMMIIKTSTVFRTVIGTITNAILGAEPCENVVGVAEEYNQHRSGFSDERQCWQDFAAQAAKKLVLDGLAVVNEHVVVAAFRVHVVERQGDVLVFAFGADQPFAVSILGVVDVGDAVHDETVGFIVDLS